MCIQDDDKPERVQNAETSVSWHDLDEQKFLKFTLIDDPVT